MTLLTSLAVVAINIVVVYVSVAFLIFWAVNSDQPKPSIQKLLSLSLFWPLWLMAGLMKLFIITLSLICKFLQNQDYNS